MPSLEEVRALADRLSDTEREALAEHLFNSLSNMADANANDGDIDEEELHEATRRLEEMRADPAMRLSNEQLWAAVYEHLELLQETSVIREEG